MFRAVKLFLLPVEASTASLSHVNISVRCLARKKSVEQNDQQPLSWTKLPKRPLTAFNLFIKEKMLEHREQRLAEMSSAGSEPQEAIYTGRQQNDAFTKLTDLWMRMPMSERQKYYDQQNEFREQYKLELEKLHLAEQTAPARKASLSGDQLAWRRQVQLARSQLLKERGRPSPPLSPYIQFYKARSQAHNSSVTNEEALNPQELMDEWKNMPADEKQVYKENHKHLLAEYYRKMDEWERQMIEAGCIDLIRRGTLKKLEKMKALKNTASNLPTGSATDGAAKHGSNDQQ